MPETEGQRGCSAGVPNARPLGSVEGEPRTGSERWKDKVTALKLQQSLGHHEARKSGDSGDSSEASARPVWEARKPGVGRGLGTGRQAPRISSWNSFVHLAPDSRSLAGQGPHPRGLGSHHPAFHPIKATPHWDPGGDEGLEVSRRPGSPLPPRACLGGYFPGPGCPLKGQDRCPAPATTPRSASPRRPLPAPAGGGGAWGQGDTAFSLMVARLPSLVCACFLKGWYLWQKDKGKPLLMRTGEGKVFIIVCRLMRPVEGSLPSDESSQAGALPATEPQACHNSCHGRHTASLGFPQCSPLGRLSAGR